MSIQENNEIALLKARLKLRNYYAIVDTQYLNKNHLVTYKEYINAKAANRRRIKQCIADLRYIRSGKVGISPLLKGNS